MVEKLKLQDQIIILNELSDEINNLKSTRKRPEISEFVPPPIFSVDKVQTPVLILHNDKDGAVPWYQGIEFFGALRRLGKPVWMLNYNDEPHWPVKVQNRVDYQIRMQQFFDYYLKGAPMPRWMQRGVPAIEKGILQGYELGDEGKK